MALGERETSARARPTTGDFAPRQSSDSWMRPTRIETMQLTDLHIAILERVADSTTHSYPSVRSDIQQRFPDLGERDFARAWDRLRNWRMIVQGRFTCYLTPGGVETLRMIRRSAECRRAAKERTN